MPRPFKRALPGHDVHTVPEMGWSGKKNGALLQLMLTPGFEAFITVDRNLRYQQNLTAAKMALIVLVATTNRLADLLPLAPAVMAALGTIQPGDAIEITV